MNLLRDPELRGWCLRADPRHYPCPNVLRHRTKTGQAFSPKAPAFQAHSFFEPSLTVQDSTWSQAAANATVSRASTPQHVSGRR